MQKQHDTFGNTWYYMLTAVFIAIILTITGCESRSTVKARKIEREIEYQRTQQAFLQKSGLPSSNQSDAYSYGEVSDIQASRSEVKVIFKDKILTIKSIPHHGAGSHLEVKYE